MCGKKARNFIGTITITVKYQGFETTFDVQVVGYEITFNANTGSGTMESVEYVGAYTLPACTFTAPDGKQFKGWSTSANGEVIDRCAGGRMADIARIDDSQVSEEVRQSVFTVACDVDTPFCGPEGAAPVFAPQKGADAEMVSQLDAGMASLAKVIADTYAVDVVPVAGAGAAGGMGGAFYAFLHATLKKGIDMVLDAIDFDTTLAGADLVITGEGKVDFQTAKGKTAAGVLARAKQQHIPVIAIGGCVEMCDSLLQMGFAGIYPILEEKVPLEIAMQRDFAMSNVTKTVARVLSK